MPEDVLLGDLREALGLDADQPAGERRRISSFSEPAALPAGARLGDFEIVAELGRGGMGVVYRARQVSLGREVALKVLPGYARHAQRAIERFRTEAQAAARLHHTNIVSVYAQGEDNGHYFYAMEYVPGLSLDAAMRMRPELLGKSDGRPDYRRIAGLLAEVADALEYAHRNGVIHRDVKPHNLLFSTDHRLHLTDFGLARLTNAPQLTLSGEVMGTPAYLSPEQIGGRSERIDHRTDVYSLGVTLYEVLTGERPFDADLREQILARITSEEPVPPRRISPSVPVELETICLRALEKEPDRRHRTAGELAEDLRRFAEGRPILSRRATLFEKAVKWARRHKALSAALAACVLVVVLGAGLAWTQLAARQREAQQLVTEAYEQLAYFDYRTPGLSESHIEPAAALGADADELAIVRALVQLGKGVWPAAIELLDGVVDRRPEDLRAAYLLAWAKRENGDYASSKATLASADERGPPSAPDAWFFRGLAVHFDDPEDASECYRKANALRAGEHTFYPQAVLHLARAHNQQLYASRTLEAFPAAVQNLELLVQHQYYGAYPYYLLSIANRLAAEVYRDNPGTRAGVAARYYTEALRWAVEGQAVAPDNDRPLAAKAECLESMGRLVEAREARDAALAVADVDTRVWEAYHYRWRLNYWLGDHGAALADLERLQAFDPQSRFYRHVYPSWVLAELGEREAALEHARAIAAEQPDNALALIWSATCLRILGAADEAAALLEVSANQVDFGAELVPPQTEVWVRGLYEYCRGRGTLDRLTEMIALDDSPWKLLGEAYFHAGALRLANGDRAGAREAFLEAYRSFDTEMRYTYHARVVCVQMQNYLDWPPWVLVSSISGPKDKTPPGR